MYRKKSTVFFAILLCFTLLLSGGVSAADSSRDQTTAEEVSRKLQVDKARRNLKTKTELAEERIATLTPYYTADGSIEIQITFEKAALLERGDVEIFVTDTESWQTLLDTVCDPTASPIITGARLDVEYYIYFTQRAGNTVHNIRGFFMPVLFEDELLCRSEFIEDEYMDAETVDEALDVIAEYAENADYHIDEITTPALPFSEFTEETQSVENTSGFTAASAYAAGVTRNELEPNNTMGTADNTYDDDDMYGAIGYSGDVDWFRITATTSGYANFWLGQIPSGKHYHMVLYHSNGSLLKAAYSTGTQQQIYRYWISSGTTYYIKILGANANQYSSSRYRLRVKNYYGNPPYFTYRWIGSMSNILFYIDPALNSYASQIIGAANSWVSPLNGAGNTTRLTRLARTTSQSSANIRFKGDATVYTIAYGETFFYTGEYLSGNKLSHPNNGNWKSCEIKMYTYVLTSSNVQGVAAYELGHCWGLDHNERNAYSIMCTTNAGRQTYWPECFDVGAFNNRYP